MKTLDRRHQRPSMFRMLRNVWLVLIGFVGAAAWAQPVFKHVGPDGRVTFSDRPLSPTEAAAQASPAKETKTGITEDAADSASAGVLLPAALRTVAKKYPATLYTFNACGPCDQGRALLKQRGIPFTERTVNTQADVAAFQKMHSSGGLPLLVLGSERIEGFSSSEWASYLDAAGYPKTSQLPKNYVFAPPLALAPPKAIDPNTSSGSLEPGNASVNPSPTAPAVTRPAVRPPRGPNDGNPSGIRF